MTNSSLVINCDMTLTAGNATAVNASTCAVETRYGDVCVEDCKKGWYAANGSPSRKCDLPESGVYPKSDLNCTGISSQLLA